jgi:cytochrome c553
MKTAALIATLFMTAALAPLQAAAEGDAARGEALAYTCLGCHGIEGYRNAYPSFRVPKLGGLNAAYVVEALKGYRDGLRQHTTMQAQAVSMSDQDMQDIAAYLATLNNGTVQAGGTQGVTPPDAAATCVACHGQNGIAVSPVWPTLAGQHESYLVHALNQYRDGTRKQAVMAQMAAPLTDEDVAVLARFYSQLEGLETTRPDATE